MAQQEFKNMGILPVVLLENAADALPLADALIYAGVPCAEFLPAAEIYEALGRLAAERPQFASFVRADAPEEAQKALAAGAKGVTGDDVSALFPGGRVEVDAELLRQKDWPLVTGQINRALLAYLDFNLRHVGINSKDEEESSATASAFERIFGFPKEDRGGAFFAGDIIEVMKKPFYGTHGHIAISTADAGCAARYLESCGVKFNWASAGYNPDGRLRVVYLQDELGGFAVHILQK